MQYVIFSYFVVIFLVVLAIEISCARQKIAYRTNGPKSFNPKTTALKNKCPNCNKETDTNTAVCQHCGAFVCYFWYKS